MSTMDLVDNLMRDFNFTKEEIYEPNFIEKLREKKLYASTIKKYEKKLRFRFFVMNKNNLNYNEDIIFEDFDTDTIKSIYNYEYF
jgi:hypothetical protein